jgi:N-methylhydantoinase A
MRYQGQSYEIEVALEGNWLEEIDTDTIANAFHTEHERLFGHAASAAPVQMVNLRLTISGATPKPLLTELSPALQPVQPRFSVEAWFDGRPTTTAVYHRSDLGAGHRLAGPAIIAQDDTTTVVPPDFIIDVDSFGNLVITRVEA